MKRLTIEDTLNARPIRNAAVVEKKWDDGQTFLAIPRKDAGWVRIFSRIFYIPQERKVYLDEIGAWVWQRCDGYMRVEDMIEELSRKFKITRNNAQTSLLKYLKKLAEKKLIGFMIRGQ